MSNTHTFHDFNEISLTKFRMIQTITDFLTTIKTQFKTSYIEITWLNTFEHIYDEYEYKKLPFSPQFQIEIDEYSVI